MFSEAVSRVAGPKPFPSKSMVLFAYLNESKKAEPVLWPMAISYIILSFFLDLSKIFLKNFECLEITSNFDSWSSSDKRYLVGHFMISSILSTSFQLVFRSSSMTSQEGKSLSRFFGKGSHSTSARICAVCMSRVMLLGTDILTLSSCHQMDFLICRA